MIDVDVVRLEEFRKKFRTVATIEGDATNELNLAKANIVEAIYVVPPWNPNWINC